MFEITIVPFGDPAQFCVKGKEKIYEFLNVFLQDRIELFICLFFTPQI